VRSHPLCNYGYARSGQRRPRSQSFPIATIRQVRAASARGKLRLAVTDIAGALLDVEAFHRDHAEVENTIKPQASRRAGASTVGTVRGQLRLAESGRPGVGSRSLDAAGGQGIDCFCFTETLRSG
jgi:hypothetical protein